MRFLLATLYRDRYRQLMAETGDARPLEPFIIQCPRCAALYLAELEREDEPWNIDEQEWAALVRLQQECPDHAHRFAVNG